MRNTFIEEIIKKIDNDDKVLFLCADIGWQFKKIRDKHPNNYINTGINEQGLVGLAAGLAHEGFKPYVYGITSYLMERALEFVKLDVVANKENVKIIGFGDYPNSGITHQTPYDTKLCDLIGLDYYTPQSKNGLIKCLDEMYKLDKPHFLKLKRLE